MLELSLVAAVIAYVAGIAAARRLGARLASFTGMAEVVFAVLYTWLLLDQLPSPGVHRRRVLCSPTSSWYAPMRPNDAHQIDKSQVFDNRPLRPDHSQQLSRILAHALPRYAGLS